jgi:hypothetical protein
MKTEIKAKWVAALRSGEFRQGRNELLTGAGEFCCLGVLCELHNREEGGEWRAAADGQTSLYMGEPGSVPQPVREWAGLNDHNPRVEIAGVEAPLACHNDGREEAAGAARTFAEIADAIEAQL